jgi:DNA recombination-mediator protein A.
MNASELRKADDTHRVFMRHEKRYMKFHGFMVGIVGSREWNNREKINEVITTLQEKRNGLCIVSGGANGADSVAKHLAIHHNIPYKEFTPEHEPANKWTVQQDREFNKEYSVHFYFKRNAELATYVDLLIAFIPEGYVQNPERAKGTKHTIKKAKKHNDTQVVTLK